MRRANFVGLNGGGFQSASAAEGGCGGDPAAPERSAERSEAVSSVQSNFAQSLEYPTLNIKAAGTAWAPTALLFAKPLASRGNEETSDTLLVYFDVECTAGSL